ncbi:MAG: CinA family protein [Dehalococcoidia bacterium]
MAGELEAELARLMGECRARTGKWLTIGTVESATGGRVADMITNAAGSSDYFRGSVVAYSNEVKARLLGVRHSTLERHGAVSKQTAVEMARGGRKLLDVDICISDTGIAGPTGQGPGKPVGLFYLGLAAGDVSLSQKHLFPGNRQENKQDAAEAALKMLHQYLLQCSGEARQPA